jgi:hypothetical protein
MPKRKQSLYFFLLKKSTEVNDKLPYENRLSIKERRNLVKTLLIPKYQGTPIYKIKIRPLKSLIIKEIKRYPARENCNVNYISPELLITPFYNIDNFIKDVLPKCVYVRVNCGNLGKTNIFNTSNYEYGSKGVRKLVEKIRAKYGNSSDAPYFVGYVKIRGNRKNDNTPENYYIDMILYVNDSPKDSTEEKRFDIGDDAKQRRYFNKVNSVLNDKIKSLQVFKNKKKRAKKTIDKNMIIYRIATQKLETQKRPKPYLNLLQISQYRKILQLLDKQYEKGLITKEEFKKQLEILNNKGKKKRKK